MKFKYLPKNKNSQFPKSPGIYAFKKNGEFLYIGKAANLRERVKQHPKLMSLAGQLGYIKSTTDTEALLLEARLIKEYQPKYNIIWRDDKNYFFIGITKELFPRIFITHQTKNKGQKPRVKSSFIGPFVSGRKLKEKLKELRKIYPYRTCENLPEKPCLWYHINQCPAPCLFKSKRVEAYDISNIQGKNATGSMVTFVNGKPDKNLYRRFKIRLSNKPNDVAMIKQVLLRRFNHPEWGLPDLILIDGGKAQLNAALSIIKIPAMALAKKRNELYMKNLEKPVLLKDLPREVFNVILQLRDEAHRFARKYHLKLRDIDAFD